MVPIPACAQLPPVSAWGVCTVPSAPDLRRVCTAPDAPDCSLGVPTALGVPSLDRGCLYSTWHP